MRNQNGKVLYVVLVVLGIFGFLGIGFAMSWCGEAAQVAKEEFGPREMLRKYEWFKNTAAALDAKKANISSMELASASLLRDYGSVKDMPRDERQEYRRLNVEVVGLKQSFNRLASEYNAQMAKFNWRFAERGKLPKGATEPLPREFKTYIIN